jgi:hypothetical protein
VGAFTGLPVTASLADGKKARDKGMAQAEDKAGEGQLNEILDEALFRCALYNEEVISDAVRQYIPEGVVVHGPAMGPAFKRAQKSGWIVPTMEFRQSTHMANHAHCYRVWKSVIFGTNAVKVVRDVSAKTKSRAKAKSEGTKCEKKTAEVKTEETYLKVALFSHPCWWP